MLRAIAPLAQERMIVLSDAVGLLAFLFRDDVAVDAAAAEKHLRREDGEILDAAVDGARGAVRVDGRDAIEEALKAR